jgi:hypothetical protein
VCWCPDQAGGRALACGTQSNKPAIGLGRRSRCRPSTDLHTRVFFSCFGGPSTLRFANSAPIAGCHCRCGLRALPNLQVRRTVGCSAGCFNLLPPLRTSSPLECGLARKHRHVAAQWRHRNAQLWWCGPGYADRGRSLRALTVICSSSPGRQRPLTWRSRAPAGSMVVDAAVTGAWTMTGGDTL